MKETMKIMGLSSILHWTAWFAKCFIFIGISFSGMIILLTVNELSNDYLFSFNQLSILDEFYE